MDGNPGPIFALFLVALLAAVIGAGFAAVFIVIVTRVLGDFGRKKGRVSPTEKFKADAEKLHRMVHPDDDA